MFSDDLTCDDDDPAASAATGESRHLIADIINTTAAVLSPVMAPDDALRSLGKLFLRCSIQTGVDKLNVPKHNTNLIISSEQNDDRVPLIRQRWQSFTRTTCSIPYHVLPFIPEPN